MKVLMLAGGYGTRLSDLRTDRNKCMIEVKGRPVIEYSLECAAGLDIDEIVVVVGHRAEDIIKHVGESFRRVRVAYVFQKEQRGLVHAMECARETVGQNDFMLMLADEIMLNPRHRGMVEAYGRTGAFVMCGVLPVENRDLIKKTYTIVQDDERRISRLVEKPRTPLNEYMGTGVCIFNKDIFDYVRYTPVNPVRGEKELTDLVQCAIDDARDVRSFDICDRYANINTTEDIRIAEEFLR